MHSMLFSLACMPEPQRSRRQCRLAADTHRSCSTAWLQMSVPARSAAGFSSTRAQSTARGDRATALQPACTAEGQQRWQTRGPGLWKAQAGRQPSPCACCLMPWPTVSLAQCKSAQGHAAGLPGWAPCLWHSPAAGALWPLRRTCHVAQARDGHAAGARQVDGKVAVRRVPVVPPHKLSSGEHAVKVLRAKGGRARSRWFIGGWVGAG